MLSYLVHFRKETRSDFRARKIVDRVQRRYGRLERQTRRAGHQAIGRRHLLDRRRRLLRRRTRSAMLIHFHVYQLRGAGGGDGDVTSALMQPLVRRRRCCG